MTHMEQQRLNTIREQCYGATLASHPYGTVDFLIRLVDATVQLNTALEQRALDAETKLQTLLQDVGADDTARSRRDWLIRDEGVRLGTAEAVAQLKQMAGRLRQTTSDTLNEIAAYLDHAAQCLRIDPGETP